jgi:hypothetical protein
MNNGFNKVSAYWLINNGEKRSVSDWIGIIFDTFEDMIHIFKSHEYAGGKQLLCESLYKSKLAAANALLLILNDVEKQSLMKRAQNRWTGACFVIDILVLFHSLVVSFDIWGETT